MPKNAVNIIAIVFLLSSGLPWAVWQARAQEKTAYPVMAPLDEYLMFDKDAEIALARSAAPKSISDEAEVMVLGRGGYTTAVKGTNGFVCIVARGWTATTDDPVFWNPKNRSPICFNPAAARSYLPLMLMRTKLVLSGASKTELVKAIGSALDRKELPALEPGAMCYMMSKEQYLNDEAIHWHPHLMFFVQGDAGKSWGADLPGSPVMATKDPENRLTVLMVLVDTWSDGTPGPPIKH